MPVMSLGIIPSWQFDPNTTPNGLGGLGDFPACTSARGQMASGASCTLPDGSNIGVWNGGQLTNPAGGAIDDGNASALIAGGWPASQVYTGINWLLIGGIAAGGIALFLALLSINRGRRRA